MNKLTHVDIFSICLGFRRWDVTVDAMVAVLVLTIITTLNCAFNCDRGSEFSETPVIGQVRFGTLLTVVSLLALRFIQSK